MSAIGAMSPVIPNTPSVTTRTPPLRSLLTRFRCSLQAVHVVVFPDPELGLGHEHGVDHRGVGQFIDEDRVAFIAKRLDRAQDAEVAVIEEDGVLFAHEPANLASRSRCFWVLPVIIRAPIGAPGPYFRAASTATAFSSSFSARPR